MPIKHDIPKPKYKREKHMQVCTCMRLHLVQKQAGKYGSEHICFACTVHYKQSALSST